MEKFPTYKRIKINWLYVSMLGGIQVLMIFGYIYQWGNNPFSRSSLITQSIVFAFAYIYAGRIKIIIDDNYIVLRSDLRIWEKIPIFLIKNVSIQQTSLLSMNIQGSSLKKYPFDYIKQTVSIKLKNEKIYQIAIKDTQIIKEEIENRMIKSNNIS